MGKQIYDQVVLMGPIADIVYLFFLTFFLIAAWNIVTAVFLENVMKKAEENADLKAGERRREDKRQLEEFMKRIKMMHRNDEKKLSKEEFVKALADPAMAAYFEVRGLEVIDAASFFDNMVD